MSLPGATRAVLYLPFTVPGSRGRGAQEPCERPPLGSPNIVIHKKSIATHFQVQCCEWSVNHSPSCSRQWHNPSDYVAVFHSPPQTLTVAQLSPKLWKPLHYSHVSRLSHKYGLQVQTTCYINNSVFSMLNSNHADLVQMVSAAREGGSLFVPTIPIQNGHLYSCCFP